LNGSIIAIDTFRIPKITGVTSLSSSNWTYGIRDIVVLELHYDHPVILTGYPYLLLDLGNHIRYADCIGVNGSYESLLQNTSFISTIPFELPSVPTKRLIFMYVVEDSDYSSCLDYVDEFSLFSGYAADGTEGFIYAASSQPSLEADLQLPTPGELGSLCANVTLMVQGQTAYETSLDFYSPPGTYGLNDTVYIRMCFSTTVHVTGTPYIELSGGLFPRYAWYSSGNLTDCVFFAYEPQPGDYTNQLDYSINRRELSSAVNSFSTEYGFIQTYSRSPSTRAFVHLNPLNGILTGMTAIAAVDGLIEYQDLMIQDRGPDYLLRYTILNDQMTQYITLTQLVFVSFTGQYELRPPEGRQGHLIGWSVAISGDIR
jgi:hypothetical protein